MKIMKHEDLVEVIKEYKDWLRESKHLMSRYRQIRGLDSSQRERYGIKYHMLNMCENKLNSLLEEFECDI